MPIGKLAKSTNIVDRFCFCFALMKTGKFAIAGIFPLKTALLPS